MELREGYKNTEVGVIPEDWEVKSIMGITTDMLQGVNTAIDIPEYVESGYPMLKANNIIDGEVNFSTSDHISDKTYQGYSDRFKIKKDDFLFSNIGARLGTGSLMKTSTECSFAWNVMRIIPNQKIVKPEFLSCIMNSPALFKEIKKNESGSGMGFVPKNVLQTLTFPIPTNLIEQTAIATALSDADALINSLEKLIAKKRNIKQGVMQQLLKPKEGWETRTLKELARYRRGSFPQPYGLDKWYDDTNGFPFVQVFDVDDNFQLKNETKRRISKEAQDMSVYIAKGSVIITLQGSIGRIAITQYDAYVDRTLLFFESFIVPFDKYFFLLSIFNLFEKEKEKAPGGIIKTITKEALSSFTISYPQIKEQARIATILSDMDAEIQALVTKLEKYRNIKLGMMQNLLTGKIRLV